MTGTGGRPTGRRRTLLAIKSSHSEGRVNWRRDKQLTGVDFRGRA
jgi:hypothetical protein